MIYNYWEKNRENTLYKNIPLIIRRRYERTEELNKNRLFLGLTLASISLGAFLVIGKLSKIKKTFIRGIYYTPAKNSLDFHLHSTLGSKWITGITPAQLEVSEKLAKNNRVDRRFIVKDSEKFKGYSYFGYPSKTQWKGKEIFDAWYEEQK